MEYQQFAIYCQWNSYERHYHQATRLNADDEVIARGLRESARRTRQASRAAWRGAFERLIASIRLSRRVPRTVA